MSGITTIVRYEDDKRSRNVLDATVYTRFNINAYFKLCMYFDYKMYPVHPISRY